MSNSFTTKIGYLLPEFPGQTHTFFWRERAELQSRGIDVILLSTRQPRPEVCARHDWAQEAQRQTTFLIPIGFGSLLGALWTILVSGPMSWWRCLGTLVRAIRGAPSSMLVLITSVLMGGHLKRFCRKQQLSHVHIHSCANTAYIGMFARLLNGPTYSLTLHGPMDDYGQNQNLKWKYAAFGIVITKQIYRELTSRIGEHLPANVSVAPMGVDLKRFERLNPYRPVQDDQCLRVFSCSRLNARKGVKDLILAIAHLRKQNVNIHLTIAGEDDKPGLPYRRVLEAIIKNENLDQHVTLLGSISENEVIQHLGSAHVFALASLEEPLGVVTMEAMAMSIPVVVTRTGGAPELLDDQTHGFLIDPQSPLQMAESLDAIRLSPETARSMGQAGRKRIETSFHSGVSAQAIVAGLRACVKKSQNPGSE